MTQDEKFNKALKELQSLNLGMAITKLSDENTLARVKTWIPTSNPALDIVMGGGFPVRRVVEIYGNNSTGKTLLATYGIREAQKMGVYCVYADIEVAIGYDRMLELGVDGDRLVYAAPETLTEVLELLVASIEIKNEIYGVDHPMMFVFDSLAALATKDELEQEWEKNDYGRFAKFMSGAMRRLVLELAENNVCLVIINQTRQKLGLMFGDGVITYGGEALKFYASTRLEIENKGGMIEDVILDGDDEENAEDEETNEKDTGKRKRRKKVNKIKERVGAKFTATGVKNRLAIPYRSAMCYLDYKHGLNMADSVLDMLLAKGKIRQKGAWYYIKLPGEAEDTAFQRSKFSEMYEEDFDLYVNLLEQAYDVKLHYGEGD